MLDSPVPNIVAPHRAVKAHLAHGVQRPLLRQPHAGTDLQDGVLRSHGGRVLCITALGDSVRLAQQRALDAVRQVRFDGAVWRNDIGHRAIKH